MNSVFGQSCFAFNIIEYFANFQFLNIKSVIYRPGYEKPTPIMHTALQSTNAGSNKISKVIHIKVHPKE